MSDGGRAASSFLAKAFHVALAKSPLLRSDPKAALLEVWQSMDAQIYRTFVEVGVFVCSVVEGSNLTLPPLRLLFSCALTSRPVFSVRHRYTFSVLCKCMTHSSGNHAGRREFISFLSFFGLPRAPGVCGSL